jgi:hypothetical protein
LYGTLVAIGQAERSLDERYEADKKDLAAAGLPPMNLHAWQLFQSQDELRNQYLDLLA